jgi:hypothetical protein
LETAFLIPNNHFFMAKKKHYLPRRDPDRVIWLNNFAAKIGNYATMFGISPTEVTNVVNMAKYYEYIITLIADEKAFAKQLTSYKNALSVAPYGTVMGATPKFQPPAAPTVSIGGIFTYVGGLSQRIKATTANYSENIGKDLGIIGTDALFKKDDYVPSVKAKAKVGMVEVRFSKKNVEGANIYSHPVGSTDMNVWVKLGFDGHPPFYDKRPLAVAGQPEKRQYQLRGVLNDEEIGQWSNMVEVVFAG